MHSQITTVEVQNRARRGTDRETPFSHFHPREDDSSFPSSASLSSQSSIRSQHRYSLSTSNNKDSDLPWLSLLVNSRSAKSEYLPMFIGKDVISGSVELELSKAESIREVNVAVCVIFPFIICPSQSSHTLIV
jgi:hypothetical protein